MPTRPLASTALEDDDGSVGIGAGVGAERIVDTARFATRQRHEVGAGAAVEIAFEECIEVRRPACG
jgi:hypothetical protein